jgi:hypothetical protein
MLLSKGGKRQVKSDFPRINYGMCEFLDGELDIMKLLNSIE